MKPLKGNYHLMDSSGRVNDVPSLTNSYEYIQQGFGERGRSIAQLTGGYEIAPRLMLPEGMRYHYNRLVNNEHNFVRLNVLEHGAIRTLLRGANAPFNVVFSQGNIQFDTAEFGTHPLIYQDLQRSFFIKQQIETHTIGYNTVIQKRYYNFFPFYHPYTDLFLRELNRSGVEGLLTRQLQRFQHTHHPGITFDFRLTMLL